MWIQQPRFGFRIKEVTAELKICPYAHMQLQEPIHEYRSQDLTVGAMMWLQEQDVAAELKMWLQE